MWSVFKLGLGWTARVEWLVDLPEQEAIDHAIMLNKRFYPEFLYWTQPPKTAQVRTQEVSIDDKSTITP